MMARSRQVGLVVLAVLLTLAAVPAPGGPWTRYYGGRQNTVARAVLVADDGGYFIVGTANLALEGEPQGNIYLLRTDAAGEILWEKTYGEGYAEGTGILATGDGHLLITGGIASAETGSFDVHLIKADLNGGVLWSKTYGGPLDEFVGGGVETADGGFILGGNVVDPHDVIADPGAAGYGGYEGRSNLYTMKIDADGNELWSHAFDSDDNILANSAAPTADGNFLVLATVTRYPDPGDNMVLMKLDGDGSEVWSRTWEDETLTGESLIRTADGNYLITARYTPPGGLDDFMFVKVDPEGQEIWRSTFGAPDMIDYGAELAETPDGGYIVVGERVKDLYTWQTEILLVKIDANGQFVWEQTKPTTHTMFTAVLVHDGFVIVGSTFRDPVFEIVLMQTDAEGHMK
jgi:hypothetical protein